MSKHVCSPEVILYTQGAKKHTDELKYPLFRLSFFLNVEAVL